MVDHERLVIGFLVHKPAGFGIALYPRFSLGVVSLRTAGNGAFAMVIAGWGFFAMGAASKVD
jgi:hypothetical protein